MVLDAMTLGNLEIVETVSGSENGSLLKLG